MMSLKNVQVRWISENDGSIAARRDIRKGEIIEVCPTIVLSQRDAYFVEVTRMYEACCRIGRKLVVVGGYGPGYEQRDPNASCSLEDRALTIRADRDIDAGEFISYDRGIPIDEKHYDFNAPSPWMADGIEVRPSEGRGLGVFATKHFSAGDIVETCHAFYLPEKESFILQHTVMSSYIYCWGARGQSAVWAMGYAAFLNHSKQPNVDPWDEVGIDIDHLAVRALKDIEPGTELLFDYRVDMGFEVV